MKKKTTFLLAIICFFSAQSYAQVNVQDSMALVDLYDSCNGVHWSGTSHWLTSTPVSAWEGVKTNAGRVTSLTLFNNWITGVIPESFGNLTGLQTLVLEYLSQLEGLPESFGNLSSLQNLNLYFDAEITSLPTSFGNLSNLQTANLAFTGLTSLPDSFGNLSALQTIYLTRTKLTGLPDSFGNLRNLQSLTMNVNSLRSLPTSFGNLSSLQFLDISSNKIDSLPVSFSNLTNLKIFYAGCNPLHSLPESFGNLIKLDTLELSQTHLHKLPTSFGNLANLQYLTLDQCKLNSLPASFGNLANLQILSINDNQLTNLPASFGNLSKLTQLFLSQNELTDLPASFGNLSSLQQLHLDENQLTRLPSSIYNLSALTFLYLYDNKLTGLPPLKGTLQDSSLEFLYLSYNNFTSFPDVIKKFANTKLRYLYLDHNMLSGELPRFLHNKGYGSKYPVQFVIVSNNYYTYDAGEDLIQRYIFNHNFRYHGEDFSFGPQANIPLHINANTISVYAGGTLSHNTYTWYERNKNNIVATITADSTFQPDSSGLYFVKVTNAVATNLTLYSDTVSFTSPPVKENNSMSLAKNIIAADEKKNSFSIYPSPAKSIINVDLSRIKTTSSVLQITSVDGKLIFENDLSENKSNNLSIDVSSYAKGIYFVVIKTKDETLSKKFVKE